MNAKLSEKRQLLARKNYGSQRLSEYLGKLSLALSRAQERENILSLEETDKLYEVFSDAFQRAAEGTVFSYQQSWPLTGKPHLELIVKCFRTNVREKSVILFARGFDYSGALRIGLHSVLAHMFEILRIDGDAVRLLDYSGLNGLILDSVESEDSNDGTYDLIVWGDEWTKVLRDNCADPD